MDPKILAKLVQIVVREEVSKIVRKELTAMKKQIVYEVKKSIPKQLVTKKLPTNSYDSIVDNVLQKDRVQQKKPSKSFSKNPILNEALNESVPFNSEPELTEYQTMGGQPMNSTNVGGNSPSEFRSMMAEKMGMVPQGQSGELTIQEMMPSVNPEGAPMQTQNVPDSVRKALTRDYTDLVKAMPKKR